ncbi:potassium-transporting ATPase subunit KdpB [Gordonia sp. NPDC003376]
MFVVYLGSLATTVLAIWHPSWFAWLIAAWLWFTVLFASMAEAVAEGRGRAQADSLRKVKRDTMARRLDADGTITAVAGAELHVGDLIVVEAGETIAGDGDIVDGIATVDESAITGESAPVVRESGGDRSAVTGGTVVLSDKIIVKITTEPGQTFVDRMISLVEGAERAKTPNEIALDILLLTLTAIFLFAVIAVGPMQHYAGQSPDPITLIALLVCLIPTTIGALLSAIGIAGMDRLVQHNVLAMSGRAVEAAGDIDTLLLDKTGTITFGNRRATALHPAPGVTLTELADIALRCSLADDTPEGRSIVELCRTTCGLDPDGPTPTAEVVPFTAQTRMSGIDLDDNRIQYRKGAADAVSRWLSAVGGSMPGVVSDQVAEVAAEGATPLVVAVHDDTGAGGVVGPDTRTRGTAESGAGGLGPAGRDIGEVGAAGRDTTTHGDTATSRVLGVIVLSDVVKPGIAERFAQLRAMGIRTVMVTGDNPLTAQAIAVEAGVDDVVAEATPEDKLALIRAEQSRGRLVAMTGDGTNDAPALAQADVGMAMNSGTSAAKEAGNMVDLDSDPTKLIDVVAIGKQLLITRGALTTFSLANDLAKYFAILPAMFAGVLPQLGALNILHLHSASSAIVSAVVFNALIIVALIPLSLRGVHYRPSSASRLLGRNLLIYGAGGVITPFIGIWLIDLVVRFIPGMG